MEKKDELIAKLEAEIENLQKQLSSEQSKYCGLLSDYRKLKYNSDQEYITILKKCDDLARKYIESLEKTNTELKKQLAVLRNPLFVNDPTELFK